MEQAHELVCLVVVESVAATVLDELKLRVDALADRRRRGLREHEAPTRVRTAVRIPEMEFLG